MRLPGFSIFIFLLFGAVISGGLTGCGFHLRGSKPLPNTLHIVEIDTEDPHGFVARQLQNRLHANGSRIVDKGPIILHLGREEILRRSISFNSQQRVAEFQLILQIGYQVDQRDPGVRVAEHIIQVAKIYRYDPTNPSGKSEEENLLQQEMRRDLLDQLMRELYLVPSLEEVNKTVEKSSGKPVINTVPAPQTNTPNRSTPAANTDTKP